MAWSRYQVSRAAETEVEMKSPEQIARELVEQWNEDEISQDIRDDLIDSIAQALLSERQRYARVEWPSEELLGNECARFNDGLTHQNMTQWRACYRWLEQRMQGS